MRKKLARTVLSLAVVTAAVFAARWAIRTAMTRAYRAERDVRAPDMPIVPAPADYSLARIVPPELHVNAAGIRVDRRAERLHMPYALAVDLADERARGAGWVRLDNENALAVKNLSGMERIYRTPEGSMVMRELRPLKGDDALMEDLVIPVELLSEHTEQTTPESLARRSAQRVKGLMPGVVRDVVIGSPLMTELVERGGGAAFIVHCVADMPAIAAVRAINEAAERSGWRKNSFSPESGRLSMNHTKSNLTFYHEVIPRPSGGACDVNYRFSDDEVYIPNERKRK